MQRKSFIQNVTIIVLAVAIIAMSVGYATFSTPLQIKGTTVVEGNSWNIKFNNVQKLDTTTVADTAITGPTLTDTTNLTFGVNLALNTKYEFTVDVVNEGTIPAELDTFTLTGNKGSDVVLDASTGLSFANNYLTFKVTYADGTALKAGDTLAKGETKTLKIAAEYKQPTSADQLPSTNESYVFTLDLNYVQAD